MGLRSAFGICVFSPTHSAATVASSQARASPLMQCKDWEGIPIQYCFDSTFCFTGLQCSISTCESTGAFCKAETGEHYKNFNALLFLNKSSKNN